MMTDDAHLLVESVLTNGQKTIHMKPFKMAFMAEMFGLYFLRRYRMVMLHLQLFLVDTSKPANVPKCHSTDGAPPYIYSTV